MSIQPWPTLRSEDLGDFRIFHLRRDYKRSPRTGAEHDFFVLECPGWVNVVALTPDRQAILVEQYRHGTNTVELEVPGGVMDAADADPVATGVRELREETGYEGARARVIGHVAANPAIQDNLCHVVLIEDCERRHPCEWDRSEDLATRLVPVAELPALVAAGRIRHSLVVAALYHFALHPAGAAAATRA
jgi:8-oxo-dGTP pyrophosphatase MutT (NUDIX family)